MTVAACSDQDNNLEASPLLAGKGNGLTSVRGNGLRISNDDCFRTTGEASWRF